MLDIIVSCTDNGYIGFSSIGYYYDKDQEFTYSISVKNNIQQATLISVKDIVKPYLNKIERKELLFEETLIPIISICDGAFSHCTSLTSASFPEVKSIGSSAFSHCTSLTSAIFPVVKNIGSETFSYCTSLRSLSFPNNAPVIKNNTFYNPSNINIFTPEIESIGYTEDNGYVGFSSIGYYYEKDSEFNFSISIKQDSMQAILISVKDIVKPYISNIERESILLEETLIPITSIGNEAFLNCTSLRGVSFSLANSIGDGAFANCTSLTDVSFRQATRIGERAFHTCNMLRGVILPSVAPIIKESSFGNLRSNISIIVPKGHSGYTSEKGWTGFKSIGPILYKIDNIQYIIDTEFNTATITKVLDKSLSETTIKNELNYDGRVYDVVFDEEQVIFAGCSNLNKITMPAQALPLSFYTFYGVDKSKISIYVDALKAESTGYTAENGYDGFKEILYKDDVTGIAPNEADKLYAFVDENGKLQIEGLTEMTEVFVYDAMGSLIAKSAQSCLDVELRSGIYYLRVGSETIKVVAK